jgi:hypothetical protein
LWTEARGKDRRLGTTETLELFDVISGFEALSVEEK